MTKEYRSCVVVCAVIGVGVLVSAFYWLPVLLEWKNVGPRSAFAHGFHYSNYFVFLFTVCGTFNRDVPTIGVFMQATVLVSAVEAASKWVQLRIHQRRLFLQLWVASFVCLFLMTVGSSWV